MILQHDWDFNDFSQRALLERAEYLIEVIDKIPDKATSKDIGVLPKGRLVIPWGPASGKSTAIRQYLCLYQMDYIIYATARKSDVDSMYYDLLAMKEAGIIVKECKIAKFHSDFDPGESELKSSNILVCTHERLMIEPPSVLYRLEGDIPNHMGQVIRSEMLIDELPKFYKAFKVTDTLMMGLGYINQELDRFRYDKRQRLTYRYAKFRSMMESYLDGDEASISTGEYGTVLGLINAYRCANITINEHDRERAIRKFAYFSDMLAEKLLELTVEEGISDAVGQNLYYTLLDVEVPNIKIFDGTGDLILRGSSSWQCMEFNKFPRRLRLRSLVQRLDDTGLKRSIGDRNDLAYTQDRIASLVNHIRNILSSSDSKLLVYTWKSIRLQYNVLEDEKIATLDNLPEYIRSLLTEEENARVEIMHYGSGKERVTSEFSDCDKILIAGKFMIPNSAISNYNEVNNTRISAIDYTKALIIQAIYRTAARHDLPIDIYFTEDYDPTLIDSIMGEFNQIILNDEDWTGYYRLGSRISHNYKNRNQYGFIRSHLNELYLNKSIELVVPSSDSSTGTRDYKESIQRLLIGSPITYENISHTNRFRLLLKG